MENVYLWQMVVLLGGGFFAGMGLTLFLYKDAISALEEAHDAELEEVAELVEKQRHSRAEAERRLVERRLMDGEI